MMKSKSQLAENAQIHFYTCRIEGQQLQHKQSSMMKDIKLVKDQVILLNFYVYYNKQNLTFLAPAPAVLWSSCRS